MPRYYEIANPLINPQTIKGGPRISAVSIVSLEEFKQRNGIPADNTDDDLILTNILLEVVNEIAGPDSLGISVAQTTWSIDIPIRGEPYLYLPRWNQVGGVDSSKFVIRAYTADALQENIDVDDLPEWEQIADIPLVVITSSPLPSTIRVTYPVGYYPSMEPVLPDEIKTLIYMTANYRYSYPSGVDAQGRALPPLGVHS